MDQFAYFDRIAKLQNDVMIINSLSQLAQYRKDKSYTGKTIQHKDGTISIKRAKALVQFFNQN